jgi:hypothetical protein
MEIDDANKCNASIGSQSNEIGNHLLNSDPEGLKTSFVESARKLSLQESV